MTKHVIRIILTVIILSTIGYVVWLFFLKPSSDVYVHDASIKLLTDLKLDNPNSVQKKMTDLKDRNYLGNKVFTFNKSDDGQTEIYNLRLIIFGGSDKSEFEGIYGDINELAPYVNTTEFYQSVSLYDLNEPLSTALKYYVPYTKFAKDISDNKVETMKVLFNNYENSAKKLNTQIDRIIGYQGGVNSQNLANNKVRIFIDTKQMYAELIEFTKNYYTDYAKLIEGIRNFVVKDVSSNNFIYDGLPIYYNAVVQAVIKFGDTVNYTTETLSFKNLPLSEELRGANQYVYNAKLYDLTYKALLQNTDGTQPANLKLITNYNNLNTKYNEILFGTNNMFTFTNQEIYSVINAKDASPIVVIKEGFLNSVQTVFEALGYNKYVEAETI